jgi:hypothetical protein
MEDNKVARPVVFNISEFSRLVVNDLSKTREGRQALRKYSQDEVRDFVENYKLERNQIKLRDISRLLFAKSTQYQRLIRYLSDMALFQYVIKPIKNIRKLNKDKVLKQYEEIGELVQMMSLEHEMKKVMRTAFVEDVFYGYVHRDKQSFYIQKLDSEMCKITSVEDGIYNYSIDMNYFLTDETRLLRFHDKVKKEYLLWKRTVGSRKDTKNIPNWNWVELDAEDTICIKINEEFLEIFPPFAGTFDSIYDIDGFKKLRKDKAELGNYMMLTQELPMRKDSENNNDFMIDLKMMQYFHNALSDTVPENVGVATSPMPIDVVRFDKDSADFDGVGKSTRDFWQESGISQLIFSSDTSTSQGLLMSIKSDEEMVFSVLTQIERWLNRYLKFQYKNNLMFNVDILHVTHFNRQEMFEMYLQVAQYGVPVKNRLSAVVGLDPVETMNMAYLENDILKMHEEFVPLFSSNTMSVVLGEDGKIAPTPLPVAPTATGSATGASGKQADGRPKKPASKQSDETARAKDKPNAKA